MSGKWRELVQYVWSPGDNPVSNNSASWAVAASRVIKITLRVILYVENGVAVDIGRVVNAPVVAGGVIIGRLSHSQRCQPSASPPPIPTAKHHSRNFRKRVSLVLRPTLLRSMTILERIMTKNTYEHREIAQTLIFYIYLSLLCTISTITKLDTGRSFTLYRCTNRNSNFNIILLKI